MFSFRACAAKDCGFTLIELMIAVAIVGILSSYALPQLSKFVTRSKLSEAIVSVRRLQIALVEHYYVHGDFSALPANNNPNQTLSVLGVSQNWFGDNSKYVKNFWWHNGSGQIRVSLTDSTRLEGKRIVFQSTIENGRFIWSCGTSGDSDYKVPPEYLPSTCQAVH